MTRLSKSFSKYEGRYYFHFSWLRSRAWSTGMSVLSYSPFLSVIDLIAHLHLALYPY